jgi:hypothetical protein
MYVILNTKKKERKIMMTRRLTKKEMWIFAIGQLGWSILGGIINPELFTII